MQRGQGLPGQNSREKRQGVRGDRFRIAQSLIASRVKGQMPARALLRTTLCLFLMSAVILCLGPQMP
jgi:hypothetical protein